MSNRDNSFLKKLLPKNFSEVLNLATVIGAFLGFGFTFYQWDVNRKNEIKNQQLEASKPFLEKQLEICINLIQVTSVIATSDQEDDLVQATKRFKQIYWGELQLVEDDEIEKSAKSFEESIKKSNSQEVLKKRSQKIADACGSALNKSWNLNLWNDE